MSNTILNKLDFVDPKKVLLEIGLEPGDNVVDYASGSGHWSITAAKIVAPTGRVLALENDIEMLNMVKGRADLEKIINLDIEEINLEKGTSKKAEPSDLVIVSNILYLIDDKPTFVKKAVKLVAPEGMLVLIEFVPKETIMGPPIEKRMAESAVIELFKDAGLKFAHKVETGHYHYGLVFEREITEVENEE